MTYFKKRCIIKLGIPNVLGCELKGNIMSQAQKPVKVFFFFQNFDVYACIQIKESVSESLKHNKRLNFKGTVYYQKVNISKPREDEAFVIFCSPESILPSSDCVFYFDFSKKDQSVELLIQWLNELARENG